MFRQESMEWIKTASNGTLCTVLRVFGDPQSRWRKYQWKALLNEAADRLDRAPEPEAVLERQQSDREIQRMLGRW